MKLFTREVFFLLTDLFKLEMELQNALDLY